MNSVGNDISKGRSMVAVIGGWLLARAGFWGDNPGQRMAEHD